MGRRIQKGSSSGTVNYVYDGANILEEVDTAGNLVTRYTQGAGVDEPLAMLKSGTTSYYEADGLGSVSSLSNSSGALASTYVYDSFGRLQASSGTTGNPYRFTSRELDVETGLYYYRARFYDPGTGRFLTEDPIGFDGGENFYRYADNNPANFIDPSGLAPCLEISKFVQALTRNAGTTTQGRCATYVRKALEASGADTKGHSVNAKDYGPMLERDGFSKVKRDNYNAQIGDTIVFQPYPGGTAGHIQVFDGNQYISDFKQPKNGIYPGPRYRKAQVSYDIYRPTPCPTSSTEQSVIQKLKKAVVQ